VERWLNAIWYQGRSGGAWLRPLAALYGIVIALRRQAYRFGWLRSTRVGCPVIVVGNVTVGGTGKTPLTIWLVQQLQAQGVRPGVLSRGHGREHASATPLLVTSSTPVAGSGDEPALIAAECGVPVVVCADRVAGGRLLESQGVSMIVCDDGLQHYALERDLEIAVVDGQRGLGNGRLLPAGPLREPPSRLREADCVVVAGADDSPALQSAWGGRHGAFAMQLQPLEVRPVGDAPAARPLDSFRGTQVHAVAGIGHPAKFFASLRAAGLDVIEHAFPDHHRYVAADFTFGDTLSVLMTCKDAVKCRAFADSRMWEVPVRAMLAPEGGAPLVARILQLLPPSAPGA
jgi:tetraacyldisaccharide 4'-kinase